VSAAVSAGRVRRSTMLDRLFAVVDCSVILAYRRLQTLPV
jgi:hypothetical protein